VNDSLFQQRERGGETSTVLEAATAMPLANINRQKALACCSGHLAIPETLLATADEVIQ
jgi:hypothetical protein